MRRLALAALVALAASGPTADAGELRILAPSPAGSGWDQIAQALRAALAEDPDPTVATVVNVPGGGGTAGLAQFLAENRDDAVLVTGLTMVDATFVHRSPIGLERLVPIARLAAEPYGVAVPAASSMRSLEELRAAFDDGTARPIWGGGPSGGLDHVAATLLVQALGIDVARASYVPFLSSQEGATAAAEGRVVAVFLPIGELAPELKSGRIRLLALASADRHESLDVPTLAERQVQLELANWRGLLARPGLPVRLRERLAGQIGAVVASPSWQAFLAQKGWQDSFLPGERFGHFLIGEQARVKAALTAAGVLKPAP